MKVQCFVLWYCFPQKVFWNIIKILTESAYNCCLLIHQGVIIREQFLNCNNYRRAINKGYGHENDRVWGKTNCNIRLKAINLFLLQKESDREILISLQLHERFFYMSSDLCFTKFTNMRLNMKPKTCTWDTKKKNLTKESQALDNGKGHLGFFSIGDFEE